MTKLRSNNQAVNAIEVVPTELINPPWDSAIDSVQHTSLRCVLDITKPQADQLTINDFIWSVSFHWLYRKSWQSRHKIPASSRTAKAIEPLGEFLYNIKELCEKCHSLAPSGYVNAAEWFGFVVLEMRQGDYEEIMLSDKKDDGKKLYCQTIRRKDLKVLRSGKNPCNQTLTPHTYNLIDVALKYADESDVFRKNTWKPFLSAYSNWIRELDRNPDWGFLTIKNGQVYIQSGRGRGKLLLSG